MKLDYSTTSPPASRRQTTVILAFPAALIYAVLLSEMLASGSLNGSSFSDRGWLALGALWLIGLLFALVSYINYLWLRRPRSLQWYEIICLLANTFHLLLTLGIYAAIHKYAIWILPPILR